MNRCKYLPNLGVCDSLFSSSLLISDQVKSSTPSGTGRTVFSSMGRRELRACNALRLSRRAGGDWFFPYMFSRAVAKSLFFECSVTQLFLAFFFLFCCFVFNQGVVNPLAQYALYDT